MPKRSKEDTENTISTIMDAVIEQILTLGYDKMSYTTLSDQTGISRTGISHHFPRKTDFTNALDSQLFNMFVAHLSFEQDIDTFKKSWLNALSDHQFMAILRLFVHHIVVAEGSPEFAKNGLDNLYSIAIEKLGIDVEHDVDWLIGKSIIKMLK
jgi:AcrR family transcriptional regulator